MDDDDLLPSQGCISHQGTLPPDPKASTSLPLATTFHKVSNVVTKMRMGAGGLCHVSRSTYEIDVVSNVANGLLELIDGCGMREYTGRENGREKIMIPTPRFVPSLSTI